MKTTVSAYQAALAVAAVLALVPSAQSAGRGPPKVRTLLEVRGPISGFAQDGNHIVWANSSESCRRLVQLRNLSTGKTVPLLARKGPTCAGRYDLGGFQHRMALAGRRALWVDVSASNSSFNFRVFTASPGDRRERQLGTGSIRGGLEDSALFSPVPLAGDRETLVYADITDTGDQHPEGVFRVATGRAARVDDTENTVAVAASGARFALARLVEGGCVCNVRPAWSPDGEWVAFESFRGEYNSRKPQLYVMRSDGTELRQLTSGTRGGSLRGWSPDGASILYERRYETFSVTPDGRSTRRVAPGYDVSWSRDGRSIAFVRYARGRFEIALGAASGAGTRFVDLGGEPDLSPDGSTIAFVREEYDAGRAAGLYVRVLAAGPARRVVAGEVHEPTWSPDGKQIAFWAGGPSTDDKRALHVVRSDGTANTQLAVRDESDSSFVPYDLSWSPASTAIAFSGLLRSATGVAPWVAVVPAAGGEMRLLAPGSEPDWAADGRDLVYVAHERESDSGFRETRREIARVDSSGSAVQILTSTTPAPRRNAVEVRRTEGGRVVAAFDLPVLPNAVALSHGRLAMLVSNGRRHAIEVRALGGSLVRKFAVPKPSSDEIFMSGRWIVFRTQSTIRGIDLKSGRRLELSKARGPVIGLSIDGRRVAWAEQGRERSRIQTLLLPG